ncbi:MAG: sugar phosphate isomerase/epimerase [Candidatus Omnitrophica bacterium]|nr:sugar phosphate isomerase/epimerase [Candidatus Omnitrophota bacterium]
MMKYAFCNEPFKDLPFEETCRILAEIGYDGVELAPFTFAEDVREMDAAARTKIRKTAEDAGLEVAGIHWLLISPKGFHLTTEDEKVREATFEFLVSLQEFCRDVGGKVLIHGSPVQRNLEEGQDRKLVEERTLDIFRRLGESAEKIGVIHCLEPLDSGQTNFIQTPADGFEWVQSVDRPGFQMMLDARASFEENLEPGDELKKFHSAIKHVHLNDKNLLGPGMGDCEFEPLFRAGQEIGFDRFYSVEPFDYSPGAEVIAQKSFETISKLHKKVFGE